MPRQNVCEEKINEVMRACGVKRTTASAYASYEAHIEKFLTNGGFDMKSLCPTTVLVDYAHHLAASDFDAHSACNYLGRLRNWPIEGRSLSFNQSGFSSIALERAFKRATNIVKQEEKDWNSASLITSNMFEAIDDEVKYLIRFALATGCRMTTALAVRNEDFSVHGDWLTVDLRTVKVAPEGHSLTTIVSYFS